MNNRAGDAKATVSGTILHDLKRIAQTQRKLSDALDQLYVDLVEELGHDKETVKETDTKEHSGIPWTSPGGATLDTRTDHGSNTPAGGLTAG